MLRKVGNLKWFEIEVAVAAAMSNCQRIAPRIDEAARGQVDLRLARELDAFTRKTHRVGGIATLLEEFFHEPVQLLDLAGSGTRRFRIARGDLPLQILASVIDALHPVVEIEDVLRGSAQ